MNTFNSAIFYLHVLYTGNHTFASVKGPQEYSFLKASLEPVWEELNELIRNPSITHNGRDISLNIVFGSDYKVRVDA